MTPASAWAVIEDQTAAVLSARLDRASPAPVAIALSGGGDSVALLIIARRWTARAGRPLVALTVDHGISALSPAWNQDCADRARVLGVAHRTLAWTGDKPACGIPAAARAARHRLLSEASREAGASVILMGHTADDRLEARMMRAEGCSVSEPRQWSPSPAWPEGRGVFVLRPMIDLRRKAIRDGLRERGETWIDDPANLDESSPRARARRRIAGGGDITPAIDPPEATALFAAASIDWAGVVSAPMDAMRAPQPASRSRFLSAAVVCAAGTARPPRRAALDRLWNRLDTGFPFAATLAGARIEVDGETVRVMRDDGAMERSDMRRAGRVLDGRYELAAETGKTGAFPLAGHMARLGRRERETIASLPPAARRGLPAMRLEDGSVTCPLISSGGPPGARSLVGDRLAAACGVIMNEAAIVQVGEMARGVLDKSASIERSVHEPA